MTKDQEVTNTERGAFPEKGLVFFTVDGRRIGLTQHTLSYLAGYSGRGEHRLTVGEFAKKVSASTKIDVADLLSKPWTYDLTCASGNGTKVRRIVCDYVPGRKPAAKRSRKVAA